jgi:hypothetical protein
VAEDEEDIEREGATSVASNAVSLNGDDENGVDDGFSFLVASCPIERRAVDSKFRWWLVWCIVVLSMDLNAMQRGFLRRW